MAKADLHVHSKASNSPAGWLSSIFNCPESYTEPKELYKRLKERGMTFITITDHNTINGVLEIADKPEVFIGCEYTVKFPEEKYDIHVLCYGIDENEHKILNELRENVYDFIDYIKEKNIAHTLAHPLYPVNRKPLSISIVEKFILLFDNWEIINGTRSQKTQTIEKSIIAKYQGFEKIRRLEEKYNIRSRRTRAEITFTGGSDDHGGMDAGRTWTEAKAKTIEDFLEAINKGETMAKTEKLGEERLINTVLRITYKYFEEKNKVPKEIKEVGDHIFLFKENNFVDYLIKNFTNINGNRELLLKEILKRAPFWTFEKTKKEFNCQNLGELLLATLSQLLPIIILYLQKEEENHTKNIAKKLKIDIKEHNRLAYITDTYYEINGVSRTAQIIKNLKIKHNLPIDIITMSHSSLNDEECINLNTYIDLPTPFYNEFRLRIPSIIDIFDLIKEREYSHIHIATPAPLGILFFLAGKIFKLPISFTFHTDVPQYILKYTENPKNYELSWQLLSWFCNQCDKILVPSKVYAEKLIFHGVESHKVRTFIRGVDTNLFNPNKKEKDFWKKELNIEIENKTKILYVGRISKEKNLDTFIKIAKSLPDQIFIIVGDGPYKNHIEKIKPKNVFITGYLKGEKLAKAYSNSDIFLFPSETETYGLVVLEAMASGLPVIVSNKGAAHEHIRHGENGFIAQKEDDYLKYIALLLTNDKIKDNLSKKAYYTAQNLNLEETYLHYINEIFFNREKKNENIRYHHILSQKKWRYKEIYR